MIKIAKKQQQKPKMQAKKGENISACAKSYNSISIKKKHFWAYMFSMLLYSILIYEGFVTLLKDEIVDSVQRTQNTILIVSFMALTFLIILIYSLKNTKMKTTFSLIQSFIGFIFANLGVLAFLYTNFDITRIQIFNVFIYMLMISVISFLISKTIIRKIYKAKCENND